MVCVHAASVGVGLCCLLNEMIMQMWFAGLGKLQRYLVATDASTGIQSFRAFFPSVDRNLCYSRVALVQAEHTEVRRSVGSFLFVRRSK